MRLADQPGRRPVRARTVPHVGMVWDVVRESVDFAPGVRFDREFVHHTGAVAVLALDEQQRVLLIRQYRHPVGHTLWEIPAGLLDEEGEAPQHAAARELVEETGYEPGQLRTLVDLRPSPGGSDEVIRVYLATEVQEVPDPPERTEEEAEILVRWVPLEEAVRAVLSGELTNGTTLTAVLALQAWLAAPDRRGLRPAEAPFPGRR